MAHPLNTPRFDERKRRVAGGYGILQPRMATTLPGANRSRYAQLYGSEPGIDPYTRSVSDVYQDLFGEGSFIGKGIYDVDAFERALQGALSRQLDPQPRPARGLLRALGTAERRAVVRGLPRELRERRAAGTSAGSAATGRSSAGCCRAFRRPAAAANRNPLSGLSLWKIFDNLRRSLVPTALVRAAAGRLARRAARLGLDARPLRPRRRSRRS